MKSIEEMRGTAEDKTRLVLSVARLPWPAPDAPDIDYVIDMQKKRSNLKKRKSDKEEEEEEDWEFTLYSMWKCMNLYKVLIID